MRVDPQRLAGADGLFEWADGEPSGALRVRVWAYTGYREATPNPVYRRETPAGEITLIDSFGDGFRAQSSSFVAGMHDRPTRTAHDGRQLGVQIRLDPLGAFALFGVPMHELGNRVVELSELLGADAQRWAERLLDISGWQDRFALLDGLLAERMLAGPVPSPEVVGAWRTMRRAGGCGPGGRPCRGCGVQPPPPGGPVS